MRKHELVKENIELWRILAAFVELHKAVEAELQRPPKDNAAVVRGIRVALKKHIILIPQTFSDRLGIKVEDH